MFSIILKSFRAFYRSPSTLFFTVFFPSICVFFLGTFLENIEVSDYAVGEVRIVYAVENTDPFSAAAFGEFLEKLEDIAAEKGTAEEVKSFDGSAYSAGVLLDGENILIYNGTDRIKNRTVKAVFNSYLQTASAYRTVIAVDPAALMGISVSEESFVRRGEFSANRSMMDYYAVTMAVLIIFFGSVIAGTTEYTDEYTFATINRLHISTLGGLKIYFGKIIGNLPMIVIQIASVTLSSTLLFGAKYCAALPLNLLLIGMFFCVSLAALSFGILLNLLIPKIPAYQVCFPILWVMMFLSGTFAKDVHIPGLSDKMPTYIVQNAAFDLTVFSRTEKAVNVMIAALILFVGAIVLSAVKLSFWGKKA